MKRLTIVRHAKSSWGHAELSDRERPLNGRGRRNAPDMGARLARAGVRPDRVLCSPAVRALTTARVIAEHIGYPEDEIELCEEIYLAAPSELIQLLRGLDDRIDHAMIFGHNPGFTDLANGLADADIVNLPTCGVVRLEMAIDGWGELSPGCAALVEFDYPKRLPA